MESFINSINGFVWGIPMLSLLLLTGLYLSIGLKGLSISKIPYAFRELFRKRDATAVSYTHLTLPTKA